MARCPDKGPDRLEARRWSQGLAVPPYTRSRTTLCRPREWRPLTERNWPRSIHRPNSRMTCPSQTWSFGPKQQALRRRAGSTGYEHLANPRPRGEFARPSPQNPGAAIFPRGPLRCCTNTDKGRRWRRLRPCSRSNRSRHGHDRRATLRIPLVGHD